MEKQELLSLLEHNLLKGFTGKQDDATQKYVKVIWKPVASTNVR